jgi:hypothetical protein
MCLRYWLGLPEIAEEQRKRFEQSQKDEALGVVSSILPTQLEGRILMMIVRMGSLDGFLFFRTASFTRCPGCSIP